MKDYCDMGAWECVTNQITRLLNEPSLRCKNSQIVNLTPCCLSLHHLDARFGKIFAAACRGVKNSEKKQLQRLLLISSCIKVWRNSTLSLCSCVVSRCSWLKHNQEYCGNEYPWLIKITFYIVTTASVYIYAFYECLGHQLLSLK